MKGQLATCAAAYRCDPAAIGKKIRDLRIGCQLRQADAAEFFRVTVNTWSRWEQGKVMPSVDNLYSLACVFDVPLDELMVGNRAELESPWKDRCIA